MLSASRECGVRRRKEAQNMKKMLLLGAAIAAAGTAVAAVSSCSYSQRGLVAQYDGINNAGHDAAHNPSATVWKDLTGNGNDGTCAASSVFSWVGGDGWSASGGCKPVTIPAPGLAATMGTCNFTIQFACTPVMDDKREAFFSQYNYTVAYGGFGLEHNSGSSFAGRLRYYKFNSKNGNAMLDYMTGATITRGTFTSASVAVSPTVQKCWLNGTLSDTRNGSISMISYSCPSVIGGEPQAAYARTGTAYTDGYGITFQGKYNAFRLYDRALTEDEAKVNAAVDAIRFNGANPNDFTLTGGWSFDGAGDLCVDVAATASGNGTVSVNGGNAPVTVKQYAAPVALSAVPSSGSVFYRWEGDTDAIVSGSVLTPSIEVSATDPVSLVAVFKTPTQALNAYSYIRKGLVANFDGIDNAGTGAHDSSATRWVDLTGNGNNANKGANASWNGTDGWTSSTDGKPMTVPESNGAATTIAGTTATKVFTAQFAVKPSRSDARQCFFGQWDKKGVSIEHNSGDSSKPGYMRAYYNYLSGNNDNKFTRIIVTANEWASMSLVNTASKQTFWKNGESSETKNTSLGGTLTNRCASIIGGDNSRDNMGFRGTYNAFRLYNRVLSLDEVKVNAAIDDRRFNGGAKNLALPSGWSLAGNMLMVDVSVTATAGGKVSYRGGAAAASISDTVNHDGSKILTFAAIPDAGYVFDRWSGDTDLIVLGSTITGEITVDPDRPVTLVAKFRRIGDAADGKIYDLSFTGDATADGITFSETDAEEKQGYETSDIPLPIIPIVTNSAVSCIYLPQPTNSSGTGVYRQMATSDKTAVTGDVATVFVRFRWDGSVIGCNNYAAVLLNGYNGWTAKGQGFIVRLTTVSKTSTTEAYPSFVTAGRVIEGENVAIADVSGDGYVKSGEWVDLFASVYPSPTDQTLSNADIWYCRTPSWSSSGFYASTIGHRHFGDAAQIPRMDSTSGLLRFGTEPSVYAGVTGDGATKVFRGAIAVAKGWNRLLTEDEMWTVMAGFDGAQSFANGRIFRTGSLATQEGYNGTATSFVGDSDSRRFWRAVITSNRTLTLLWNAPTDKTSYPMVYKTEIGDTSTVNPQPMHIEVNGHTVWSGSVVKGDKITVEIDASYTHTGLNRLVLVDDAASKWIVFRYHELRLGSSGLSFILR